MILEQAQWFKPDDAQVGKAFTELVKKYKQFVVPAKQLKNINKEKFSFEKMTSDLSSIVEKFVPEFAIQVELNLPKLELPKLQKANG